MSTADITWLNTNETARRLGITPRTLYRFIDDGRLPAYRFGRVIRLKESEVANFIEECRITPGSLDKAILDTTVPGPDASNAEALESALTIEDD
ncbi:MAG: helix-turn-helix domain-containing protein [Microthrixaceae bacterium]